MRHLETKFPNQEQTHWGVGGEVLGVSYIPWESFSLVCLKLKQWLKEPGWTQCPVWMGFHLSGAPMGGPQTDWWRGPCRELFHTKRPPSWTLLTSGPFERVPRFYSLAQRPASSLRHGVWKGGRRSFCRLRDGRGQGSDGETPIEEGPQTAVCQGTEECLSHFQRKKTNKQTKRSKEKGKKGNHGAFFKEPKTAISASRRVGKIQLCSDEGIWGLFQQEKKKNHPLNNQMPLDWLQKAVSGGVHSACWLPTEMRACPQEDCHSPKVEFLARSWGPCDKGLKGLGLALAFSLPTPHEIKMLPQTYLPLNSPLPLNLWPPGFPEDGDKIKAIERCLTEVPGEESFHLQDRKRKTSPKMNFTSIPISPGKFQKKNLLHFCFVCNGTGKQEKKKKGRRTSLSHSSN